MNELCDAENLSIEVSNNELRKKRENSPPPNSCTNKSERKEDLEGKRDEEQNLVWMAHL